MVILPSMIIGIVADTHDHLPRLQQALDRLHRRRAELILHAGDFVSPFTAVPFERSGLKVIGVFGNNDGDKLFLTERFAKVGELHHGPYPVDLAGRRVLLMHEPYALEALADSGHYDLLVYGHLHEPRIEDGPPLVVNPGECCGWLSGRATCALVDLRTLSAELIDLSE